jgi:hypothetical protein
MTHEQIPAASQTPNDTITTPIVVNLPLKDRCSDRSSHLSAERDCRKNDGICLFEANTAFKRRKLNHVQPSTTLLSFLRIEEYDGKVQDFSNTIKAALNSWSNKRAESFSPFKDLKAVLLENAPCPLKYNDGRMLLEDVLLLMMPGQTAISFFVASVTTLSLSGKESGGKTIYSSQQGQQQEQELVRRVVQQLLGHGEEVDRQMVQQVQEQLVVLGLGA